MLSVIIPLRSILEVLQIEQPSKLPSSSCKRSRLLLPSLPPSVPPPPEHIESVGDNIKASIWNLKSDLKEMMSSINQGMNLMEIEQIVAQQVANAIETIAIYETKTIMAHESMSQAKRQEDKKRRNDVKTRTTLLLALPDEHQLRLCKYETAKELWEAILKTFGGNEATKKTKKNQLKLQHGNFKAEGSETLEQTFNRLQAIVGHLEFMDVEIEQDYLNQKFLTSLAPEWLIVQNKSESNSQNMAFISSSNTSSGKGEVHTASVQSASTQVFTASTDVAAASLSHDTVSDDEVPTEFALMAKSSSSSDNETGLLKFVDDTVTDYRRPTPSIDASKCNKSELQSSNFSIFEHGESTGSIMSKPMIKFVKEADCHRVIKINNTENARKSTVKYAEMYMNISKGPKVRGNQRNWNNLKSQQLGKDFLMQNKSCFKSSYFDHLASNCGVWVDNGETWPKDNYTYKSMTPKAVLLKPGITPIAVSRPNMNVAQPKMTSLLKHHIQIGYVSFGHGGGKITGKGIIKTDFKSIDDTNVLLRTPRQHTMYSIDLNNIVLHKNLACLVAKALVDESMLWHRRLGHLNSKTMNKLVRNNLFKVLPSKCFENDHTCVACLKGKQHKASCKTKLVNSVSKRLHTLHMDLFGPTSVSSLNHKWYCLVVADDFSSCDNEGEFKNQEMNEFCTKKGIRREFSNVRTPQQNEVAEKRNRTLIEAVRTMLADAKLPVTFWAEAVNTACYVQNRVLVNKSQNKTPYELFNSRIPAIGFLRPFGCHVMILNTLDHLGSLMLKGMKVILLENKLIEKGAGPNWLFDIDTLTNSMNYVSVVVAGTSSINISGTKDVASQAVKKDVSSLRYIALPNCGISNPITTSKVPSTDQVEPVVSLTVESDILTVSSLVPTVCLDISPKSSSGPRLVSKGVTSKKETPSLGNALTLSNRFKDTFGDTTNAVTLNEVEVDLSNMETSIRVTPTPNFRIHKDHPKSQITGPIDTPEEPKKIFDALKDPSWVEAMQEELLQFKIQNEEGIDYEELFTPVARIEAIILFLAYASFMSFIVYQMDFKSSFLYGTINEEVYVLQSPRFQDLEFLERVYKVEKAMYGLHQAPRAWYGTLSKEFEALMHDKFQMSAMGELTFFLDLQVLQKKDDIFLSQDKYVGDILKKFGYSDVRPDIMFAVYACARHQVTPKECHLYAVKRIFRYLKGHPKLGLWYFKESSFDLVVYSDSDYGGATQDRKSTTGGSASGCGQVLWIQNQMLDYRRHLKVNDEEGISSLPDAELFENLSLMGYNILPNQRCRVDRENIAKTSAMPHESSPRVPSLDADEGSMQQRLHKFMELCTSLQRQQSQMANKIKNQDLEISKLKARVKSLEDKEKRRKEPIQEDAPITWGIIDIWEELGANKSTKKGSNDTEEMVNVLSSIEAANILLSGGATISTASVSLADVFPTAGVPTVTGSFPTVSTIFTTASVVTPYTRRSRGITIGSLL
nr:hypothetical protein [Tanacetum cinerariifolium]